ncbi:hypothetical protein [Marinobacter salarius]|jgi:hypothetical protein|uniref:hypothetical protein n=1 Tax=Marinobacter salarius TaxID=1420917 RepID=UPI0018F19988|nr:hypothetical protein [Marinobacter salarius]MBJ7300547.1 hypothetical protein [Marinobacter salarius]HIO30259.1 hypothetical protein [Marinobacter salarius]HIO98725.1 hypothetical protein [Marinobacter salarius]
MLDYYYLSDLEHGRYNLSLRDALHLAAKGTLPSYVHVHEDIRLYELDDDITTINSYFYLRIPTTSLRIVEKFMVSHSHTPSPTNHRVTDALKKHELSEVFLDGRYEGSIPIKLESRYYGLHEICPFPFRISTLDGDPFTFSADELIFWTNDLEELVKQGLIQRRDIGRSGVSLHNGGQGGPPNDEDLPNSTIPNDREQLPADFKALLDTMGDGDQENIDLLLAAWRKFWKDRRPHDGHPYPINPDVQKWILNRMEGNGSQIMAENMAKIIRPKWAPKHRQRKQEK